MLLRAPMERVWRAIADSQEFGRWFGVQIDGPFVAGTSVTTTITGTTVDDEVAELQRPHAGAKSTWQIVAVDPPRRFAYRWHPFAVDSDVDYDAEPTTLVEFTLSPAADGVLSRSSSPGSTPFPRRAGRRRWRPTAEAGPSRWS